MESFINAYRLYGSTADGTLVPLTPAVLPAQGENDARYSVTDTSRHTPPFARYVLEVIEADGVTTQIDMGRNPVQGRAWLPWVAGQ